MANTQYLLWVMIGTLTLLSVFISALVGRAKSPRLGFITFAVLFLGFMAAIFFITR
ncbi:MULTISPECIES: hypothetical protein [Pantoea]|uniref:hypothetical protein n=1 Tax=Pantoea TaxID=53335 RepID=UPI00142DCB1A|nr:MULTISPECIES: hypothetical protein [Pantoea]MBP2198007.1 uncharacterized protein involved in exopolysaccharide biosynthesis [Pantoea cypripedii]